MIGTLIGAGLGVVGSIYGGIKAAEAAKKARAYQEQKLRDNQLWFDRKYHEDATQRADAQRMITKVQEMINKRNRQAQGMQAVMGSTAESVATAQEAGNAAIADTASRIAAQGEARKDLIEQQYIARRDAAHDALSQIETRRAGATAQATSGLLGVAGNIASGWGANEDDTTTSTAKLK